MGLERAQDFMFRLNFPSLASYPVAAAAVLVCAAVLSLKIYQGPSAIAVSSPERSTFVASVNAESDWNLATPVATRDFSLPLSAEYQRKRPHSPSHRDSALRARQHSSEL